MSYISAVCKARFQIGRYWPLSFFLTTPLQFYFSSNCCGSYKNLVSEAFPYPKHWKKIVHFRCLYSTFSCEIVSCCSLFSSSIWFVTPVTPLQFCLSSLYKNLISMLFAVSLILISNPLPHSMLSRFSFTSLSNCHGSNKDFMRGSLNQRFLCQIALRKEKGRFTSRKN